MTSVYKEKDYEISSVQYMCHPETCCHDAHHPYAAVYLPENKGIAWGSEKECLEGIEFDKQHRKFRAAYPFMKLNPAWRDVSVAGEKPRLRGRS
jgi:hypothetical protein